MKNISVVIVSYNNAEMLRNLLTGLARQSRLADRIIVVDNASSDRTSEMVAEEFAHIDFIRLPENTGSSGGYNVGIAAAMAGADGIWTLDDDVELQPDSLRNLVAGYVELSKSVRIGAVRSVGARHPIDYPTELDIAPWRGTLWSGDVVRAMGAPRSDYFIYGEDLEYSLRMHKYGYVCYWIPASKCIEVRKGKTDDQFLGTTVRIYSSPFRLYYAFRNELNILLSYHRIGRLARLCLYAVKVVGYVGLTERFQGGEKITAVLVGLAHGLLGRLGKSPRFLP